MNTLQQIQNISPENPIEESIKADLLILEEEGLSIPTLFSELHDDPEAYDFDEDDLETFIFKYNL